MIYETMVDLATCLTAQIQKDGSPPTCFSGVIPGDAVVAEYGGDCDVACGSAWVRMVASYPASGVGQVNEMAGNCGASMGADLEIGILRCISVGDESGNPPTPAELLAATQQQTTDMLSMWRAVACCDAVMSKEYTIRGYQPIGPQGGLVGGALSLSVV